LIRKFFQSNCRYFNSIFEKGHYYFFAQNYAGEKGHGGEKGLLKRAIIIFSHKITLVKTAIEKFDSFLLRNVQV